ncbi:MAG: tetratricopeptide repeat protein [Betaproteobacteria bacterium]|jgi:tetratricopeptide (TPR) repeat protein
MSGVAPTSGLAGALAAAVGFFSADRLAEAEQSCHAILQAHPHSFDALHLLAVLRCRQGDFAGGLGYFDRALAIDAGAHDALANRGNALLALGRFGEAVDSLDAALAQQPDNPDLLNNRGNALQAMKRYGEALASYESALALRPRHAGLLKNRGNALAALGRFEPALASYERALQVQPEDIGALNNRGGVLRILSRLDEALACYDQALALMPAHAETLSNRGNALHALRRVDEAIACYGQALALQPDYADAHWNLGLALLVKGELAAGWKEYEWRWKLAESPGGRNIPAPLWHGHEDLRGKTILLHAEQGLGDTLQFCRYVTLVQARGAIVILEVDAALKSLLASLAGVTKIVVFGDALPPCDYHCPLLSLPLAFATTLETIPAGIPYLYAEPAAIAHWQKKLGQKRLPRIGIAWSGNPAQAKDRNRSLPLEAIEPLLALPLQFVCLQKEIRTGDAQALERHAQLLHFESEIGDFGDTAALVEACDLVIAVNSVVAHLAGAMGKAVWIPLAFVPDWRFLLDREDSPWYPGARLFRQSRPGQWDDVVARMVAEIRERWMDKSGLRT